MENKDGGNKSFQSISDSSPLVKGSKVSYNEALQEVKKIIRLEESIHIDGFSTDLQSMYKVIDFAEKYRASINHMCSDELNIFFSAFQKYGGSFVSFNELKKRADFVLVVGARQEDFSSYFFKDLNWDKQKKEKTIFFLNDRKIDKCSDIIDQVNYLKSFLLEDNTSKDSKLNNLKAKFIKSKFPVVLANIKKKDYALTHSIFDFVKFVNKKNRIKIFNIFGSHNSGGFVNACVTKTGYPNAINFTEIGPLYEPNSISLEKQKKIKNIQIYISNFEPNPNLLFFKNNIFIGHPNFVEKNKVDVFLPTTTPGFDANGLIVRSDNGGILKLEKNCDSNYLSPIELIEEIQKN
tara:strand:- start:1577 stop:2626 length:1050 start_codon:yes stop_codon:yes gene_type:complete